METITLVPKCVRCVTEEMILYPTKTLVMQNGVLVEETQYVLRCPVCGGSIWAKG